MTLQRKTPLRRTPMRRAKTTAKPKRPLDTGPSQAMKDALWARADGRCEVCGTPIRGDFSRHHRLPRGRGGINCLSNLLLLCGHATSPDGCHATIESQRTVAYGFGWLVRTGQAPADEPALVRGTLRFLTPDGSYADRPEVA